MWHDIYFDVLRTEVRATLDGKNLVFIKVFQKAKFDSIGIFILFEPACALARGQAVYRVYGIENPP